MRCEAPQPASPENWNKTKVPRSPVAEKRGHPSSPALRSTPLGCCPFKATSHVLPPSWGRAETRDWLSQPSPFRHSVETQSPEKHPAPPGQRGTSVKLQETALGNASLGATPPLSLSTHTHTQGRHASLAPLSSPVLTSPPVNSLSKDGAES